MPREVGKLTALKVTRLREPRMYGDGGNLWLQVGPNGTKSWVFRYMLGGKEREMGLGPLHTVSLSDARTKAAECRRLCLDGVDPIEARKKTRAQARLDSARSITFKSAAESYIEAHKAGWRNDKHAAQWGATLKTYAYPHFGSLPVQGVDVAFVMKALEPIWSKKPETATRLRGRIESVLDWATARGYRIGENPARWRGHLENLLPARKRVRKAQHHAALPYDDMSTFMEALRLQEGTGARALEFLILTATRTSETLGAKWDEIDLREGVWTLPAERMKGHKEHRVPLAPEAVTVLKTMRETKQGDYVFPGLKADKPLSNMALLVLLRRMKRTDLTVHGFRSTFRDWAAERTNFPREVAEMALAHAVSDRVEAAYRRGDLFEKRRRLIEAWAKFCGTPKTAGRVVAMKRRSQG